MANTIDWGQGAVNNTIGWGKGKTNATNNWGSIYDSTAAGETNITGGGGVDTDAQAFITAASITDPTQQSAINTLVTDLKGYGVWTKMKAIYPFVGGTATQHKWNLKDPRDLDVAFRLVFSGGVTHSSNGVQGNALNGYYNTYLNANSLPITSNAAGIYIRTNVAESGSDFGAINANAYDSAHFSSRNTSNQYVSRWYQTSNGIRVTSNSDSRGFYQLTRRNINNYVTTKGTTKVTNSAAASSTVPSMNFYGLAAYFVSTNADAFHSSKQVAFHYFADSSLSDTELDNMNTAVQAFQTTLGRSIGTQTVSDADAQAFVTAADIQDQVEANAINNLVIGLKADSLWSKMKAIYPFVGGTATSHSFNLINPSQFQISWSGGVTHSINGVLFGGVNGYGNTGYNLSTNSTANNVSAGTYSRTNSITSGAFLGAVNSFFVGTQLTPKFTDNNTYYATNDYVVDGSGNFVTDTRGFFIVTRVNSTNKSVYRNGTQISTSATTSNLAPNLNIYLGARNSNGTANNFDSREHSLDYIGDLLTGTEIANFYTAVQAFQTALNRNV